MNETRPAAPQGIPSSPPRPPVHAPHAPQSAKIAAMPVMKDEPLELDPIELVDDGSADAPVEKKIRAFGVQESRQAHPWKRQPHQSGAGACRVRSFHGKYSEQGLEYLDNAINDWLDNNPEVEVKFVTSTVMTFEGKIREPALVLNIWY